MELSEFNEGLLGSLKIKDTGDGMLSWVYADNTKPFTVTGKRAILPTADNLRHPKDGTIVFHPLSENIARSESDMIKALRDAAMYRLTTAAVTMIQEMARVAASPSEHKGLGEQASRYLKNVTELDERTYDFIRKVMLKIGREPDRRLVSISLHKGKDRDGVLRRASVKFPVLDALESDSPTLLDVKYPSKKAKAMTKAIFEVVLGDAETRESYSYGSSNMTAPYFHALMTSYSLIAGRLNEVLRKHTKLFGKDFVEETVFDLSWVEGLDELPALRRVVPPQEGNEGAIVVAKAAAVEEEPSRAVAERIAPRDRRPAAESLPWEGERDPAPVRRRDNAPVSTKKGISLDDFFGNDGRRGGSARTDDWGRRDRDWNDESFSRNDRSGRSGRGGSSRRPGLSDFGTGGVRRSGVRY